MKSEQANVVIVGGGIIGASIAWHLAKEGTRDVVLVEREAVLGVGSTRAAAGGIRAQFSSEINIRLSVPSIERFEAFSREMDCHAPFHQNGYLWVATQDAHLEAFRRNVALQNRCGVPSRLLTREEVAERAPWLKQDDVLGAAFSPKDGYASPADFLAGYESQARKRGVRIETGFEVTEVMVQDGRVRGVRSADAEIRSGIVINACGAWAGELGRRAGVDVPVLPYRRQVFVTQPFPKMPNNIPLTIDYATGLYLHSESGGFLLGWSDPEEPSSFSRVTDERCLEKIIDLATRRVPLLEEAEILRGWAGLYETTPDHHPILGEAPEVKGFWLAVGFSGHGFMHAPITGQLITEMLTKRSSAIDVSCLSLRRFREGKLISEKNVI